MIIATPTGRRRALVAALLLVPIVGLGAAQAAPPQKKEKGPFFGAKNIPTLCAPEMRDKIAGEQNPDFWRRNVKTPKCHHMRTDMNGLDSPKIDVLIMVPISPAAERDMRIMRQSVEMWEGGLQYIAEKLNMRWLAKGMEFHITVDTFEPGGKGGEFTTYPIVDPEIVVVATNPAGGLGIGIDPIDFANDVFGSVNGGEGLCHGIPNAADIDAWKALPGFSSHHSGREGIYTEDCGGSGGNICFAVNGGVDPVPGEGPLEDFFALFDLVSHEVGHCLSIGHVGDGAEGKWGGLPPNDIMAYNNDPPGRSKCVSSLDLEGIALRMSKYLDVNGDKKVSAADRLLANDQVGDGRSPFQVQRPADHFYASATGLAKDCPQPDLGLLPGERTNWKP
ncbi:MAG TPA: hypothetical protein VNA30_04020 [Mycobacteriales bacterium]|nr:hypothetical protein [Mycobacteriales bacterium]